MVLTNGRERIDLSADGFKIEKITPLLYQIKSDTVSYGSVGELYMGSRLGRGKIELEGYIGGDEPESKYRELLRACYSKDGFELIDGDYKLSLCLERGVELASEKRFMDKLLRFKISAIAPYPLWQALVPYNQTFVGRGGTSTDETAIRITNSGDVAVPIKATIWLMSSCESVTLSLGDEKIFINHPFKVHDKVFIDTSKGKKSVTYIPSGSEDEIDIIGFVSPKSDFFELDVGENRIDFAISGGTSYITIEMTEAYMR